MVRIIKHDMPLRIVKLINVFLKTLPFVFCWYGYYSARLNSPFFRKGNWVIVLLFVVLYAYFGQIYEAFHVSLYRISEMVYSQALACLLADGIMYILTIILMKRLPNPLPYMGCLIVQILLAIIWSVLAHKWYFKTFEPKRAVVIYDVREGFEHLIKQYGLEKKFRIVGIWDVNECLEDLAQLTEMNVETVFLSGVHSKDRNVILKYCVMKGIDSYVIPRVGDVIMSSAKQMHLFHLPILRVDRYNPTPEYLFFKRLFDIISSSIVLVVASPIMLITAVLVKLDGGPALYKQKRLTKNGKEFNVLKFRSMIVNAEGDGVARLSTGDNDDRITKVGSFIRKVRIDELPQLINILKGDMSVVGPRPERPEIAIQYEEEMPEFRLRLQAKAGLTGYAQVYGKYNTTPYDKLQMDLIYIANSGFFEDLRIIFATIKIIFMPESTEGVATGQTTAMDYDNETYRLNDGEIKGDFGRIEQI